MANFAKRMLGATRKYTIADFGILKLSLISVGILLGLYFGDFLLKYITTVWIIAVLATIFILIQQIRYSCNCRCRCKKKD